MHFYDFNIGDFAKKTQHLTNEEELAYRRALDLYYDTEKPLDTQNIPSLSRRLRVGLPALQNVLDEFFPNGVNKHADEKIKEYYAFIAKQVANGKKGGRPKNHTVTKPEKPTAIPPLSQNKPMPSHHYPLPTSHLPENKTHTRETALDGGQDFDDFWKRYPKKTGKAAALKSWKKCKPPITLVMAALDWQIPSEQWTKDNGQFIPHPATYINQGRWNDEPVKINGKGKQNAADFIAVLTGANRKQSTGTVIEGTASKLD